MTAAKRCVIVLAKREQRVDDIKNQRTVDPNLDAEAALANAGVVTYSKCASAAKKDRNFRCGLFVLRQIWINPI